MKRALVTGASGFLGRHCLPRLVSRGYEVHAVSRRPPAGSNPDVRWHPLDLLDRASVSDLLHAVQPTHLLHLAWCTEHGAFWTSPDNLKWVEASLALTFDFCASRSARRLVGAGTCAEYAWQSGLCAEYETPRVPATLYGACKHGFHTIMERYAAQSGVSSAWGRLFLLYGPEEHPDRLIPSVARSLLAGEPARCTHGNQVRDFLFIVDAADAFVALLDSDADGAFNVASGEPTRLADAIARVADRVGRPELVRLGALPARDEPEVLVADVTRVRTLLGWSPAHSLREGLDLTVDWWATQPA